MPAKTRTETRSEIAERIAAHQAEIAALRAADHEAGAVPLTLDERLARLERVVVHLAGVLKTAGGSFGVFQDQDTRDLHEEVTGR